MLFYKHICFSIENKFLCKHRYSYSTDKIIISVKKQKKNKHDDVSERKKNEKKLLRWTQEETKLFTEILSDPDNGFSTIPVYT